MKNTRYALFLSLLVLSCSNSDNNPQGPISSPPYARLVIPTFPAENGSGANRTAAATAATYWNGVSDSLANLRGLLESAKNVTPSVVGDSEEVTWTLQLASFTGTLKRTITDSAVWELRANGPGLTANAVWAAGKSTLDAQNGYWTVNNTSSVPWLRVKYFVQDDSTVAEHIPSGSSCTFYTVGDTNTMTVYQKSPLPTLWKTMTWSISSGAGKLLDRMTGQSKCWGPKSGGYADLGQCP